MAAAKIEPVRPEARRGLTLVEAANKLGGIGAERSRSSPAAIELGDRIRSARQFRQWTQAELAARAGLAQGDLSNIERGKGVDGPSVSTIRAIALALEIELPIGSPHSEPVIVEGARSDVTHSSGDYTTFAPLLTLGEWEHMRDYARAKVKLSESLVSHGGGCMILQVGSSGGISTVRSADEVVVVAPLRGAGTFRFHKAMHRKQGGALIPGIAVGILGREGSVDITPEPGGSMAVMMIAAAALLRTKEAENC